MCPRGASKNRQETGISGTGDRLFSSFIGPRDMTEQKHPSYAHVSAKTRYMLPHPEEREEATSDVAAQIA